MIFWIVIGLSLLTSAFLIWYNSWRKTDYWDTLGRKIGDSILTFVLVSAVTIIPLLGTATIASYNQEDAEVYFSYDTQLVALESRDSIDGKVNGSIFATYGYVGGAQVLSYISKGENGGMQLGQLDADLTTVYEGYEKPHITTYKWTTSNKLFFPWPIHSGEVYSVYVPKGSVTQDFNVAP